MPRAQRVCRTNGCSEISSETYCPTCQRANELARGTAAQRGYGYAHRRATARALAGATHCAQCGQPFTADNPATGGHVVARRHGGTSADGTEAQCRTCNYGWRRTGL